MSFKYDSSKHEVRICNKYHIVKLQDGKMEVPMILKTKHGYLKTENPEYRDKTDNEFLRLDFIFDNQDDADTMYNLLKKGTIRRIERYTGRFKEQEELK